ncbi:MAG: carboxymuconolactone decarboxylase family protein [Pusillimonas sp.]
MPRVPFVSRNLAEPEELVKAIRLRRGGQLSELDRLLLHSPPFAQGWNTFLGQIRTKMKLDPKVREIVMCGVALINDAQYEYDGHLPELLKAGGTREQGEALRDPLAAMSNTALFTKVERAAIRLYSEMTSNVRVNDATFEAAREALGNTQELVELVGTIAAYNMVSRFLVAMNLVEDDKSED